MWCTLYLFNINNIFSVCSIICKHSFILFAIGLAVLNELVLQNTIRTNCSTEGGKFNYTPFNKCTGLQKKKSKKKKSSRRQEFL